MSEDRKPPALDDLKARVTRARRAVEPEAPQPDRRRQRASAMGFALRISVELAAGVVVGGGIGWFLDRWLGTTPGFLLLFFFLGAGAGIRNVFRAARDFGVDDEGEHGGGEDGGGDRDSPPE